MIRGATRRVYQTSQIDHYGSQSLQECNQADHNRLKFREHKRSLWFIIIQSTLLAEVYPCF